MALDAPAPLPSDMIERFSRKGTEGGGPAVPPAGDYNGLKVRRILQVIEDLADRPLPELSVLDLGCGEGVYALEAALRGATVRAVDARTERMREGEAFARRLGLTTLRFEQADVRHVTADSHGRHDIVLFLGILYHLDVPDAFHVLTRLHEICRSLLIVNTQVTRRPDAVASYHGVAYRGTRVREHDDADPPAARRARVMRSIDNSHSFLFTRASLTKLLVDIGFTTVLECHAPLEPFQRPDRVTLIATGGRPVTLSTYPWLNAKTEAEIEAYVTARRRSPGTRRDPARVAARILNRVLRPLGLEIRRLDAYRS